MRTTMLRLALLGTIASLPALAQTTSTGTDRAREPVATHGNAGSSGSTLAPPSAGAARGNESRADSVRPDMPNQGRAAGQGAATSAGQTGTNAPATSAAPRTDMRNDTTGATTPNRGDSGGNNAVQLDGGTRAGPLEHGANSFTEGQARSRMEAAGFTNLEGLRKDDNGIWRGRAMRAGQQVEVGLDYRGNVAPLTR